MFNMRHCKRVGFYDMIYLLTAIG